MLEGPGWVQMDERAAAQELDCSVLSRKLLLTQRVEMSRASCRGLGGLCRAS